SIGRNINYLRISVTDRCNLRCRYCMPEEGVHLVDRSLILTYKEIEDFTRIAVAKGIDKVRITGGEPLVRRGIITLVEGLAPIEGIKDFSMTTNGVLLSEFAHDLFHAGLKRINISLDTTDPEKYAYITRGGSIERVFEGITAAKKAGLWPVKINCVVEHNRNESDAEGVARFAAREGLVVRYIPLMNLKNGKFSRVDGGEGGNCINCNRLRLNSTGMLKPCLFNNIEFNIRELGAERAIELALQNKPVRGDHNTSGCFYNIGG
ncbi:MAG: radical SAM protein, partial [Bacteroidales bacterium]